MLTNSSMLLLDTELTRSAVQSAPASIYLENRLFWNDFIYTACASALPGNMVMYSLDLHLASPSTNNGLSLLFSRTATPSQSDSIFFSLSADCKGSAYSLRMRHRWYDDVLVDMMTDNTMITTSNIHHKHKTTPTKPHHHFLR